MNFHKIKKKENERGEENDGKSFQNFLCHIRYKLRTNKPCCLAFSFEVNNKKQCYKKHKTQKDSYNRIELFTVINTLLLNAQVPVRHLQLQISFLQEDHPGLKHKLPIFDC